jgi:hypothetical protein
MSINLLAPAPHGQPDSRSTDNDLHNSAGSVSPLRKNTMNSHYFHVQELQRERLRQAESYRLQRLALRARRAVASQLVR